MKINKVIQAMLLMLIPFSIAAQEVKLEGTYNVIQGNEGYRFTFSKDSSFEYHHVGKTSLDNNGKGFYKIKGDSIIFNFIDFDTVKHTIEVMDKPCKNPDSSILNFKVYDIAALMPLNRAIVSISDANKGFVDQAVADSVGQATIHLKNKKGDFFVNIFYDGPNTHAIKIHLNGCKDIKFYYPRLGHVPIEKGTVWRFKIKEMSAEKLTLQKGHTDTEYLKINGN